jgi:hypothetical protein
VSSIKQSIWDKQLPTIPFSQYTKKVKTSKPSGLSANWEAAGPSTNFEELDSFSDNFGGIPEAVDETQEYAALKGKHTMASRQTSQVSRFEHGFKTLLTPLQQSIKITRESSQAQVKPRLSSSSVPKLSKPKVSSKMADLEPFYTIGDIWATVFLRSYIEVLGADPSPWAPTFNIVKTMQELRDTAYPNTTHKIDKQSAVYRLVRDPLINPIY